MTQMLINLALAHKEFFIGAAVSYAMSHIPEAVLFCFHQAMRIPWLRDAVAANPAKAKAIIDAIHDELDKDIDAEASSSKRGIFPSAGQPDGGTQNQKPAA